MVEELKKAGGDSWDVAEFRKELKAIVRLKSKLPELIYSGNKDKYEEIVQKINTEAAWTNRRVKKILNTEEDYIKKPAPWEKVQQAYESYLKATSSIKYQMGLAAKSNKRRAYDKLERKLEAINQRLGERLGFKDHLEKGEAWSIIRGLLKNPEVRKMGIPSKDVPKMWWIVRSMLENPFIGKEFDRNPDRIHELLKGSIPDNIDKASLRAIRDFTGHGYSSIRKAQAGGFTDLDYKYNSRSIKNLLLSASRIEKALEKLPKPEVEKYRGITVSDGRLKVLIKESKGKKEFSFPSLTSWSNSWEIGKKFAGSVRKDETNRVFYRTINRRGSPIGPLSRHPYEDEILTPSNTSFKYHRYYTYTDKNGEIYHIFEVEEL